MVSHGANQAAQKRPRLSIKPPYFRRPFISLLPHEPGVCRSTTAYFVKLAVHRTLQSGAAYPYPYRWLRLEEMLAPFSFEECQLQEEGHLPTFRNNGQGLLYKLQCVLIRWVGDDIAIPFSIINGEEISHLTITSVNEIT